MHELLETRKWKTSNIFISLATIFYLLDYVTQTEIYQIGNRKKNGHGEMHHYMLHFYNGG